MEKVKLEQVWETYRSLPAYQHILILMKNRNMLDITQEDFNQLDEWDAEMDAIADEAKKGLSRHDEISFRNEEPEIWQSYLRVWITELDKNLKIFYTMYDECRDRGMSLVETAMYTFDKCDIIDPTESEVKLKKYMFWLKISEHKGEIIANRITDEMVEKAKEYPIENLLQFGSGWKTRCIFHNEKTPSMSLNKKLNYVKCFGCGKKADVLDVYMHLNNKNFVESVRALSV
jgi:hypothetical protein